MGSEGLPGWSLAPFPVLVVALAALPVFAPRVWERRWFQALVVAACALPVVGLLLATSRTRELTEALRSYVSFIAMLAALYITSGGVHVAGDIEAKPATNVALMIAGAMLASLVGTTGASMLLIRPLLRSNRRRRNRAHLVPFFILMVANAGGMLTPLGDPPLLIGYLSGVPFFWTLRLFPAWLLYVGSFALALYLVDRRAYAREPAAALARERAEVAPLTVSGRRNIALMLAVVPAALLPFGYRELALVVVTIASLVVTPRALHEANGFSFGPIVEVGLVFAGIFGSLYPVEAALVRNAAFFPVQRGWQLFWASGLLSAFLDNAPTYKVFASLSQGLSAGPGLVAGIAPVKLAAVSIGTVVMGATTYIGNGPNLMIKAIAGREGFPAPSFLRYACVAFAIMLPAHLMTTIALLLLDR